MEIKAFEEIEDMAWSNTGIDGLTALERVAYGNMRRLVEDFNAGKLTREKATTLKLELKEKYYRCIDHVLQLEKIHDFVLKAEWGFNNSEQYVDTLVKDMGKTVDKVDGSNRDMYVDFLVAVFEHYEKRMKEGR